MNVYIKLTNAGVDTDYFSISASIDGVTFGPDIVSGISRATLLSGYDLSGVPNDAIMIRLMSNTINCNNYIDLDIIQPTPIPTPTQTLTSTPTPTQTLTSTAALIPPTPTSTLTLTPTPTLTQTLTSTPTQTPTPTPSATLIPTSTFDLSWDFTIDGQSQGQGSELNHLFVIYINNEYILDRDYVDSGTLTVNVNDKIDAYMYVNCENNVNGDLYINASLDSSICPSTQTNMTHYVTDNVTVTGNIYN